MPISNDSLNKKLYQLLKTQGFDPVPKNSKGDTTPVPDDADVFRFTFKVDGKPVGPAWVTVDSNRELKVYYDDEVMGGLSEDGGEGHIDDFTEFLQQLKMWAQRRQLGFDLENQDHLESDMAQREHVRKQEQINEGYYPMGKSASYNDSIPSVKIILQHTRQIQEGEQRFRNIARIFLENTVGERILAPTTRPGIAKVYARHLAEGGLPHDERWNHIGSLVEEYTKMAGFVRATRGNQFNESAQQLVNEGLNHYQSLRETLSRMIGHRGYNAYFESWTPALMEDDTDNNALNELFVQETMDPRIESVMPILSRLQKKVNEMSEVKSLEEWADTIISEKMVMGASSDASSSGSYKMGEATDLKTIPEEDLEEDIMNTPPKSEVPAYKRKEQGGDWKVSRQDLEKEKERNISGPEGIRALQQRLGMIAKKVDEEEIDESGLQAYLGNKKYGKEGMDALRKAGRDHASKEKMAQIRAKYDKLDETADVLAGMTDILKIAASRQVPQNPQQFAKQVADVAHQLMNNPATKNMLGYLNDLVAQAMDIASGKAKYTPDFGSLVHSVLGPAVRAYQDRPSTKVAEDLGPEQKRVGQLGPTEKVGKKGAVGKLVGANESVDIDEGTIDDVRARMQSGSSLDRLRANRGTPALDKARAGNPDSKLNQVRAGMAARGIGTNKLSEMDTQTSGKPGEKGSKATPIKADKAKKDFGKMFQKNIDKANKAKQDTDKKVAKHVKEGQEDLEAILRIIRK